MTSERRIWPTNIDPSHARLGDPIDSRTLTLPPSHTERYGFPQDFSGQNDAFALTLDTERRFRPQSWNSYSPFGISAKKFVKALPRKIVWSRLQPVRHFSRPIAPPIVPSTYFKALSSSAIPMAKATRSRQAAPKRNSPFAAVSNTRRQRLPKPISVFCVYR